MHANYYEDGLDENEDMKPVKIGRRDKAPKQKNFKSDKKDNTFRKEKDAKKKMKAELTNEYN